MALIVPVISGFWKIVWRKKGKYEFSVENRSEVSLLLEKIASKK